MAVNLSLAKGADFQFKGETYTLSPWTYDIQAEYEKYMIARAWANLRAARLELPGSEYTDAQAALRRDIDAGVYEFGKPLLMQSLNSERHFKHLCYLCIAYSHRNDAKKSATITKSLIDDMFNDDATVEVLFNLMGEVNRDPNSQPEVSPPEVQE